MMINSMLKIEKFKSILAEIVATFNVAEFESELGDEEEEFSTHVVLTVQGNQNSFIVSARHFGDSNGRKFLYCEQEVATFEWFPNSEAVIGVELGHIEDERKSLHDSFSDCEWPAIDEFLSQRWELRKTHLRNNDGPWVDVAPDMEPGVGMLIDGSRIEYPIGEDCLSMAHTTRSDVVRSVAGGMLPALHCYGFVQFDSERGVFVDNDGIDIQNYLGAILADQCRNSNSIRKRRNNKNS